MYFLYISSGTLSLSWYFSFLTGHSFSGANIGPSHLLNTKVWENSKALFSILFSVLYIISLGDLIQYHAQNTIYALMVSNEYLQPQISLELKTWLTTDHLKSLLAYLKRTSNKSPDSIPYLFSCCILLSVKGISTYWGAQAEKLFFIPGYSFSCISHLIPMKLLSPVPSKYLESKYFYHCTPPPSFKQSLPFRQIIATSLHFLSLI